MRKIKLSGFTLSELLISLLILGIIATFIIPKILTSQTDTKRLAIFKETIATLNGIFNAGWSQGDITETNFGTYVLNHINAYKVCDTNAFTQGCWPTNSAPVAGQQNVPGVILHSGAMITGLDNTDSGLGFDLIIIDWNGSSGTNIEGDDQIVVKAVITSSGRTGSVREDSSYPTSRTLWLSIFQ